MCDIRSKFKEIYIVAQNKTYSWLQWIKLTIVYGNYNHWQMEEKQLQMGDS